MEIIIALIALISGLIGAYFGHRFQVSRDKLNTQRERLLKNILKIEQFLDRTLEMEYLNYLTKKTDKEIREIEGGLDRMIKEDTEIMSGYKEDEIKLSKIEKSSLQEKKKTSVQNNKVLKSILTRREEDIKRLNENIAISSERMKKTNDLKEIGNKNIIRLNELIKDTLLSDTYAMCKMIDPSEKLEKYISELVENQTKMVFDKENASFVGKSSVLRYEIRRLLESKIK